MNLLRMAPSLPESFKSQVSSEHKSRNSFVFTEVQTTTFNSGCSEDTVKKATRNNSGYEEKARGEAEQPEKKLGVEEEQGSMLSSSGPGPRSTSNLYETWTWSLTL